MSSYRNRSVIAFKRPGKEKAAVAPSFVVTRQPRADDETLSDYAARQLAQLAKGLPGFSLRGQSDVEVDGTPAVQCEFLWNTPSGIVVQRMTMTAVGATVIVFTSTAPIAVALERSETFDRLMASVKLHAPELEPAKLESSRPSTPPADDVCPGRDAPLCHERLLACGRSTRCATSVAPDPSGNAHGKPRGQ